MNRELTIRRAAPEDLDAIRAIYNEGIADRVATLDVDAKTADEIADWWAQHDSRFAVIVASREDGVAAWASLNRFSHRCAHTGIADLSVYVARAHRGQGIGYEVLRELERCAVQAGFRKIVLHALDTNEHGKALYRKCGFTPVGVFREHGVLDGRYVDVIAMEKLLH